MQMKPEIDKHKKEMLVPFLKNQMRELKELIDKVEREEDIEVEMLQGFFDRKTRQDRQILKLMLKDEQLLFY